MHQALLTPEEIDRLSQQIDQELLALSQAPPSYFRCPTTGHPPPLWREKQQRVIEQATGEPAASFWTRFKRAARKDLCEEGGQLYQQWHEWGDLSNKRLILFVSGVMLGLGIEGETLITMIVPVVVTILHLGLKVFCAQGD